MLPRILEIAEDGRRLCKERGSLAVYQGDELLGRAPLDDLGLVLCSGRGILYTQNLLVALAERAVPLVLCDAGHRPMAILQPYCSNEELAGRMEMQINASQPLRKRLWRQIVQAKIGLQAMVALAEGADARRLAAYVPKVKSGDPENMEGAAARLYWPLAFGPDFRRNPDGDGANALLNYGYAVLRGATARAVFLAGLHPAFGLHHCNRRDSMRLVDDLMEPYRPLVDLLVLGLLRESVDRLDPPSKRVLAGIAHVDVETERGTSTVYNALQLLAVSLVDVLAGRRRLLAIGAPRDVAAISAARNDADS